jgi:hypothetical protein
MRRPAREPPESDPVTRIEGDAGEQGDGLELAVHVKLGEDRPDLGADGGQRHHLVRGDHRRTLAPGEAVEHQPLARGQPIEPLLQRPPGRPVPAVTVEPVPVFGLGEHRETGARPAGDVQQVLEAVPPGQHGRRPGRDRGGDRRPVGDSGGDQNLLALLAQHLDQRTGLRTRARGPERDGRVRRAQSQIEEHQPAGKRRGRRHRGADIPDRQLVGTHPP